MDCQPITEPLQIIPSERCLGCDVCCRFPERDSPLRPYFTAEEIERAVARGVPREQFPDPSGGRVRLIPHPAGDGFICPAFDPATNGCRIYSERPLDCRIYPFTLLRAPDGSTVLFGVDRKCPVVRESVLQPAIEEYARDLLAWLRTEAGAKLAQHPGLVGPPQTDVIPLGAFNPMPVASQDDLDTAAARLGLAPLQPADEPLVHERLFQANTFFASQSWPALSLWRDDFRYFWALRHGTLCLFAAYTDGVYMPLPPIGAAPGAAIPWAWGVLESLNHGRPVGRIDNIAADRAGVFAALGFELQPAGNEYLYATARLAALAGNDFKAQRHAINRAVRAGRLDYEPFRRRDLDACLYLLDRWRAARRRRATDPLDHAMLDDTARMHARGLESAAELNLTARVVRRGQRIVAYTVGFAVAPDTFCVALEVGDPDDTGIQAYIFRELCREHAATRFINTMGDCGIARLAAAKRGYRPARVLQLVSARKLIPPV